MTWMRQARESQRMVCDQVRANALEEGGLQPVVFLLAKDAVAPVVIADPISPEEIFSATDQLAREMAAEAGVLAFEMMARRTDSLEVFTELVEEGSMRTPSQSVDRKPAILWHRFGDGKCERELDVYEDGSWRSHGTTSLETSPVRYFRQPRQANG